MTKYLFSNFIFCFSKLEEEEKEQLGKKVVQFGGKVVKDLTSSVTHLVSKVAGSKKHQHAILLEIQILLPSWIEESIEGNSLAPYEKYTLKPLQGLVIANTGLEQLLKNDLKENCTQLGGEFIDKFHKKVNYLIAPRLEIKSEKIEYAKKWGIPIVKPLWIFQIEKLNQFVSTEDFILYEPIIEEPIIEKISKQEKKEEKKKEEKREEKKEDKFEFNEKKFVEPDYQIQKSQVLTQSSIILKAYTPSQMESQNFIFEDDVFYLHGFNNDEKMEIVRKLN